MNEPRIIVALGLRSYRETIASAMGLMSPGAEILLSDPESLDREVRLLRPRLVLCSRATPEVQAIAPFWVEMYREHGPVSTINTPDGRWEIEGLELSDIADLLTLL